MLMHVVLMRLQPGVSSAALDDLARRVSRLTELVAGQDSCVVDPNVTEEPLSQEFEFGFVVRFAGHAEPDAYHQRRTNVAASAPAAAAARSIASGTIAAVGGGSVRTPPLRRMARPIPISRCTGR